MKKKVQTAFRLYPETFERLDSLVESPPAWLSSIMPGPVQDRTDVVERLVFLAVKHTAFGMAAVAGPAQEGKSARTPAPAQKPKKQRKS